MPHHPFPFSTVSGLFPIRIKGTGWECRLHFGATVPYPGLSGQSQPFKASLAAFQTQDVQKWDDWIRGHVTLRTSPLRPNVPISLQRTIHLRGFCLKERCEKIVITSANNCQNKNFYHGRNPVSQSLQRYLVVLALLISLAKSEVRETLTAILVRFVGSGKTSTIPSPRRREIGRCRNEGTSVLDPVR